MTVRSKKIGRLRFATWGGKGYIMRTRGFALSWVGRKRLLSTEIYFEERV